MTINLMTFKKPMLCTFILASLTLSGCQLNKTTKQSSLSSAKVQTQQIDLTSLYGESATSSVTLSADGQWIAFLKTSNGAQNIHLVQSGKQASQAIPLTHLSDSVDSFVWSHNKHEILFSKDTEGNENAQVYRLRFDPSNLEQSVNVERLTHNDEVSYRLLSQLKDTPHKAVLFANHLDSKRLDFFALDMNTQTLSLLQKNDIGFYSALLDKAGNPTLATVLNGDNSTTLYKRENHSWKAILHTQPSEVIMLQSYNQAQNTAYISGSIQGRDKQELILVDLTSDEMRTIHKDPLGNSDLHQAVFNENGEALLASYYGARLRNYPLTAATKTTLDAIKSQLVGDFDIHVEKINQNKDQWFVKATYANQPDKRFVYNPTTHKLVDLLNQDLSFNPENLGVRKSITYTAKDGVEIQAYLTLPQHNQKNLPAIILPHGGPWVRDNWEFSSGTFVPVAHYFANRGYAVLQPNFRGSLGFGKHFTELGNNNWGTGTMQQDLTDGVQYLIDNGIADKARIGIMGGSYGGYAALSGATFTPDLYRAAVSYVGPSSLIAMIESFPDYYRPYLGSFFAAVGDPQIESNRKDMESRSPINFVENIKAPILLIQGANDPRVPQPQSEMIAKKLFDTGREVEYVLAKDEGHGFLQHNNKLAVIIAMENFFAKHLGGAKSSAVDSKLTEHLATLTVDVSKL